MKEKFNIIFLDIDGVLNGYNKWNLLGWNIVKRIKYKPLELWYKRIAEPFGVHESKVKRLAKIVEATNAKVVMSSSWRHGWWKCPYEEQYEDQRQLTDLLNKYNIEVIDITPTLKSGERGYEICKWLSEHKSIVNSFIILDDEASDMSPFTTSPRFIQTSEVPKDEMIMGRPNENTGLKRKHIKPAIRQLQLKTIIFY